MGENKLERAPEAGQATALQTPGLTQADNNTLKELRDSKSSSDTLPKITIGNVDAAAKIFDPTYPLTGQLPFLDRRDVTTRITDQSIETLSRKPHYSKVCLDLNNPSFTSHIGRNPGPIPVADQLKFIHRKVELDLNDGSFGSILGGGKFYDTKYSVDTWSPAQDAGKPSKARYNFADPRSITLGDSARGQISLQAATSITITDGRFPTDKYQFPSQYAAHRIAVEDKGSRQITLGTAKDGTITALSQNTANDRVYPGTENGQFLKKLPKLQLLTLMSAGQEQIAQTEGLTDLRQFRANLNSDVTSGDTLKEMDKLEFLRLTGGKISNFEFLQNKPEMRTIELNSVPITGDQLANLDGMKKLETLNLWNSKVDDSGMAHISKHPTLKSLELGTSPITDEGMKEIAKLKGLNNLDLYGSNITDAGVAQLADFHDLKALNLSDTKITDQSLKVIGKLHSIEELTLHDTKITDSGLAHLNGLKGLTELSLGNVSITDKGLAEIVKLDGITKLTIDPSKLTNEGLKQIADMKNLKELVLYGQNYPNKQLNMDGFKELAKLKPELAIIGSF